MPPKRTVNPPCTHLVAGENREKDGRCRACHRHRSREAWRRSRRPVLMLEPSTSQPLVIPVARPSNAVELYRAEKARRQNRMTLDRLSGVKPQRLAARRVPSTGERQ